VESKKSQREKHKIVELTIREKGENGLSRLDAKLTKSAKNGLMGPGPEG
jgi:hypothetical protein